MTTVLLTDGLAGSGEDLVQQMFERMHSVSRIVGGAAGDEAKFDRTLVGMGATVAADSAVALHVFSRKPWGIGVDHGLRPTSSPMRVTRASGNIVHEIDGAPAFEAYRAHAAKRGTTLSHANASPYMIANEIGIHFFERITRARAPLSTDAKGALTCASLDPRRIDDQHSGRRPGQHDPSRKARGRKRQGRLGGCGTGGRPAVRLRVPGHDLERRLPTRNRSSALGVW